MKCALILLLNFLLLLGSNASNERTPVTQQSASSAIESL
jgi:hypothetical protein